MEAEPAGEVAPMGQLVWTPEVQYVLAGHCAHGLPA